MPLKMLSYVSLLSLFLREILKISVDEAVDLSVHYGVDKPTAILHIQLNPGLEIFEYYVASV